MGREYSQVVADIEMFRKAKEIREWMVSVLGTSARLNESPNPFYGSTVDGLVLIEHHGTPTHVGTPLGEWVLTDGAGAANPKWKEQAFARLGLKEIMPSTYVARAGHFGPVYVIQRAVDGSALPLVDMRVKGFDPGIISVSVVEAYHATLDSLKGCPMVKDEPVVKGVPRECVTYDHCVKAWLPIKEALGYKDYEDEKKEKKSQE